MTILNKHCPVARKPHRCDYCGDTIPVGQRYKRWVCVSSGQAMSVAAHAACDDVAEDGADRYSDGWDVCLDALTEWAAWRDNAPAELRKLATAHAWPDGELERVAALTGVEL